MTTLCHFHTIDFQVGVEPGQPETTEAVLRDERCLGTWIQQGKERFFFTISSNDSDCPAVASKLDLWSASLERKPVVFPRRGCDGINLLFNVQKAVVLLPTKSTAAGWAFGDDMSTPKAV
ncbi:unnamed protein product [Allacma fusca]|uniref:Uncharacterized protein n=1 Tax=Allacma fusca TaxID=39272 RepID=A0A8J2KKP5_9HEXA|nr:unnamed protein product [Allacma fusca]